MCLFLCLVNVFEGFIVSQNEFFFNEKRNALVFNTIKSIEPEAYSQDDLNLFGKWFIVRKFTS